MSSVAHSKGTAIALAAVAALFCLGGKGDKNAAPKKPKPVEGGGGKSGGGGASGSWDDEVTEAEKQAAIVARVAKALATNDPVKMRAEAGKLRAEGYELQANALEKAAATIELSQTPPTKTPTSPAVVPPELKLPAGPRVLKRGMSGDDVLGWQNVLQADGFSVAKTGVFDEATEAATKEWQLDHGLEDDGQVGDKTRGAVGHPEILGARILKLGSQGKPVLLWKKQLKIDGYPSTAGGTYDQLAVGQTMQWQAERGATGKDIDGKVGPKTWKLVGHSKVSPAASASTAKPSVIVTTAPSKPKPVQAAPPLVIAPKPTPVSTSTVKPPFSVDPDKWRVMRRGTAGTDVGEWQWVLNRDGYATAVDNRFGPDTEAKTRLWQKAHGLAADGVVGKDTRGKIATHPENVLTAARVSGDLQMSSPLPGILPMQVPTEMVPADRSLAARLALHLFHVRPGDEDRELVAHFQRTSGLNDSGAYGPSTALAFVPFGIAPPKPFYWPRKGLLRMKALYRITLLEQAKRDPQRADEWASQASV
jgi:peptidoglycan hydrolase-like protein with peptidoglycan-binding domain